TNGIFHLCFFSSDPFNFIDILANRTHPVCIISLLNIFHLITVHCRCGKPYFVFECFYFHVKIPQFFLVFSYFNTITFSLLFCITISICCVYASPLSSEPYLPAG